MSQSRSDAYSSVVGMADDRLYIKVHNGMPDHPKVAGLSDKAFRAIVSFWCYCDRHYTDGTVPGVIALRESKRAVAELEKAGLIESRGADWYCHDYLEHQRSAAEVAAMKEKRRVSGSLGGKARAANIASAKASASDSPKQTPSKVVAEEELEKETEELLRSSKPTTEVVAIRQDVDRICEALADLVEANGSKRPRVLDAWRDSARLLMDKDGRSEQQILWLLNWCQSDSFWRGNILSMPTFREKFDRLRLAAQREYESRKATNPWTG